MDPKIKIGNREISETLEEVVIRIEGLRKRYGEIVAVDGLNLTVNRGEVFGILGPNGAGKTTTLETIEGLRKPDAGEIEVAGYDAVRESEDLKRIIGVQLQSMALFDYLTVRETLKLFADLYGADASPARIRNLLDVVSFIVTFLVGSPHEPLKKAPVGGDHTQIPLNIDYVTSCSV